MSTPKIGDDVRFIRDGVQWQGRVNDIRARNNTDAPNWSDEPTLCVSVLGWPHMFYLRPTEVLCA